MASVFPRFKPACRPYLAPSGADWRAQVSEAVTDPDELCRELGLASSVARAARRAAGNFKLLVPRPYLTRIRTGDPADPLLLQVLPRQLELGESPGFASDPLGEAFATRAPGLLWKYPSRALIVATRACAVHCRYCFRRHFPRHYPCGSAATGWDAALRFIAQEPTIREVILSGGDPLMVVDEELANLVEQLSHIAHLHRLRIHTRLPVMIPARVTDELLCWLRGTRLATLIVLHVNHPAEIDAAVAEAIGRLVDAGLPVLNQSVLLAGVNDSADVLAELCERLVDLRVIPYYLHQLDKVAGAAHFEVPEQAGAKLIEQVRARLPGYAVPRYVREVTGARNKVVLA